jgi:hypothetical protein
VIGRMNEAKLFSQKKDGGKRFGTAMHASMTDRAPTFTKYASAVDDRATRKTAVSEDVIIWDSEVATP